MLSRQQRTSMILVTTYACFVILAITIPAVVDAQVGGEGVDVSPSIDEGIFYILKCFIPCAGGFTGNEIIPSTDCKYYHECWEGFPRSRKGCGAPLLFNEERDYCDFPRNVDCPPPVICPPTASAYLEPAPAPVKPQPTMPGGEIIVNIPSTVAPYKSLIGDGNAISHIESKRSLIETQVLKSVMEQDITMA